MSEEIEVEVVEDPPATDVEEPLGCPEPLIEKFTEYYGKMLAAGFAEDGILERNKKEIMAQFELYNLTAEEKAKFMVQMYIGTTNEATKLAASSALALIKQEAETPLKCAQVQLVMRQIQGYDESMLIKTMEQQASVTSFAVNSDSDYAQDTINDLKCLMAQINSRSVPLENETPCSIVGAPTPIPSNLSVSLETDVSMLVSWQAVVGATTYTLSMDGVVVYSGGAISFDATGLNQLTKYAFNIFATGIGGPSKLSNTVVGITTATAP